MERVKGIEPSQPAWKAGALPLSYTRILKPLYIIKSECVCQQFYLNYFFNFKYGAINIFFSIKKNKIFAVEMG